MPTIHRQDGFQFRIYPADHEPSHVHVFKAGGQAKIILEGPELYEAYGLSRQDLRRALEIVGEQIVPFLKAWEELHG